MENFTTPELLACVAREVALRESCYPKWARTTLEALPPGRRKEIDMMRTVYKALEVLRDITPQPYTFDSPVEGNRVLVYLDNGESCFAKRTGLNEWDFDHTFSGNEDKELSKRVVAFSYPPALPTQLPSTDGNS